jgi:succinyl-CoA synthetase alpha subunit
MSILINKNTKIICQGMTGKSGTYQSARSLQYGTQIVAGVTPGKGGQEHLGLPIFDTVKQAVQVTGATASIIYVPVAAAKNAILEAAESGIKTIVCITEGIPVHDLLFLKLILSQNDVTLIGPNTPGIITPGEALMGIMPIDVFQKGKIGIISRSGTLLYEFAQQITQMGLGQSTCVGIGGDGIIGADYITMLDLFQNDKSTDCILMIGEIGGNKEELAAQHIISHITKPVIAYIAGYNAPQSKRMGHAGAIINHRSGTATSKQQSLTKAGVIVIDTPLDIQITLNNISHEIR